MVIESADDIAALVVALPDLHADAHFQRDWTTMAMRLVACATRLALRLIRATRKFAVHATRITKHATPLCA
jgi:hypothetical protein